MGRQLGVEKWRDVWTDLSRSRHSINSISCEREGHQRAGSTEGRRYLQVEYQEFKRFSNMILINK